MPRAHAHQRREPRERNDGMQRNPMTDIAQIDERRISMRIQRQYPRRPHMEPRQWRQCISQRTRPTQRRPGNRLPIPVCLGAIALQRFAPAVEAQCDAGGDVCGEREDDEEGLGDGGLVVWASEEERAVCRGYGAREERDEGGVGDVEGGEDCEGVGRVFLGAGYYQELICSCRGDDNGGCLGRESHGTYTTKSLHDRPVSVPVFRSS